MKVTLQYAIPENLTVKNLDSLIELSNSLRRNIDSIEKGGMDVSVEAFLSRESTNLNYRVNIYSKSDETARVITYSFLHHCGIPYFVSDNCNFMEGFLNQSGKTLKRKFNGLLVGKHVVDKQ